MEGRGSVKNWNEEAKKTMKERFGKDAVMALATMENGMPSVRYVNAYYEDGAFYIITNARSGKMRQIKKEPRVALAGEWFTAHGMGIDVGEFVKEENRGGAEKLKQVFSQWIDNGHNDLGDENTIILCVKLTDGILLSHGTRYEF